MQPLSRRMGLHGAKVLALPAVMLLVAGIAAGGALSSACGGQKQTASTSPHSSPAFTTRQQAIETYCDKIGLDMPELQVAGEGGYGDKPTVSAEDPDWEIDYAFPADAEGEGSFFLVHKVDGRYTVVAHSRTGGWTAGELQKLGAPGDLAPVQAQ